MESLSGASLDERFAWASQELRNGSPEMAEHVLHQILREDTRHDGAIHLLAVIALETGLPEMAESLADMAVSLSAHKACYHLTLGLARIGRGEQMTAIAAFNRVLELDPARAEAHYNIAVIRQQRGEYDAASTHYGEAVRLRPDFADAWYGLAVLAQKRWEIIGAIELCRAALRLDPGRADIHSNLLYCLHFPHDADLAALHGEHLRWAEKFARFASVRCVDNGFVPSAGKIRIGYLSPDFRLHPVARFLEPLLVNHDRSRFEIFAYADILDPDDMTERFRLLVDGWRDIRGLTDDEAARLIAADGISILVDLAGHTSGNRLGVLARRPASVQAAWLGYPDTTGLDAVGYRITDDWADPPGLTEQWHSERLVRLPGGFLCYQPQPDSPPIGLLPCLASGRITFGSFNNLAKVTPEQLALWVRLLHMVPGSMLLLKAAGLGDTSARNRVFQCLVSQGVSEDRFLLLGAQADPVEHLNFYNNVDICLDTYPYNGTTTSCEALWMGVPVITLAGCHHVARVGASILSCLGLPELVAGSAEEYLARASALANNPELLEKLRRTMRQRMSASPLLDGAGFARRFEDALSSMASQRTDQFT